MNKLSYISSVLIDPYRDRKEISKPVSCLVSIATGVIFLGAPHVAAAAYRQYNDPLEPNLTHQKIAKLFKSSKKTKAEKPPEDFFRSRDEFKHPGDQKEKESLDYPDELVIKWDPPLNPTKVQRATSSNGSILAKVQEEIKEAPGHDNQLESLRSKPQENLSAFVPQFPTNGSKLAEIQKEIDKESLNYDDDVDVEWIKPAENTLVSKLKRQKEKGKEEESVIKKNVHFTEVPPQTTEYDVAPEDDLRDPFNKKVYPQKKKILDPTNSLKMWEKELNSKRDLPKRKSISTFPDLFEERRRQQLKSIAEQIIANKETLCTSIDDFVNLQKFCIQNSTTMENLIADEDAFKLLLKSDRIRRILFTHFNKNLIGSPRSVNNNFYKALIKKILDYSVALTMRKLKAVQTKISKNSELIQDFEITTKRLFLKTIREAFPGTKEEFFDHELAQDWLLTDDGVRIKSIVLNDGASSSFGNERSSSEYLSCSSGSERSSSEYSSCSSGGGERASLETLSFTSEPTDQSSSETLTTARN